VSTNITSVQDNEWLKRCENFEQSVLKYKSVRFSRFISPHDLAVFKTKFKPSPFVNVAIYGGAKDCERVMLGFFPDFQEPDFSEFPINPLVITGVLGFSHRDILGSVLGLGIKREMTGDIFIDGDTAIIMTDSQVSDYLLFNLKTVGRKKVTVEESTCDELVIPEREYEVTRHVIASERLDAFVSAAGKLSRSEAASLIEGGGVSVNFSETQDTSKKLKEGDVISIRHKGRFILDRLLGETRKGRISVEIKKYI